MRVTLLLLFNTFPNIMFSLRTWRLSHLMAIQDTQLDPVERDEKLQTALREGGGDEDSQSRKKMREGDPKSRRTPPQPNP